MEHPSIVCPHCGKSSAEPIKVKKTRKAKVEIPPIQIVNEPITIEFK